MQTYIYKTSVNIGYVIDIYKYIYISNNREGTLYT